MNCRAGDKGEGRKGREERQERLKPGNGAVFIPKLGDAFYRNLRICVPPNPEDKFSSDPMLNFYFFCSYSCLFVSAFDVFSLLDEGLLGNRGHKSLCYTNTSLVCVV